MSEAAAVLPLHPGGKLFKACPAWDSCRCMQSVREEARSNYSEELLNHLTTYTHPLTACKLGQQCPAHLRLCAGGYSIEDMCHHAVYTHGRPGRAAWDGASFMRGSEYVEGPSVGATVLCGSDALLLNAEIAIANQLDACGLALVAKELDAHGLGSEMHLVNSVVPRLRRNPRLREAHVANPWAKLGVFIIKDTFEDEDYSFLSTLRALKKRPVTDVELLGCLLYTGTDAQGKIRKALRASASSLEDLNAWKWTIHAIRHAAIKLAEAPPDHLYHGLNNVKLPHPDTLFDPGEETMNAWAQYEVMGMFSQAYDDMDCPDDPYDGPPPSGSYSNLISGSMSLDMARKFAFGQGGTVVTSSVSGCVLHFSLGKGAGKLSWKSEGLVVADLRWISKFPDEQEWLIVPMHKSLALFLGRLESTSSGTLKWHGSQVERAPDGGEVLHVNCTWWRRDDDPEGVPTSDTEFQDFVALRHAEFWDFVEPKCSIL